MYLLSLPLSLSIYIYIYVSVLFHFLSLNYFIVCYWSAKIIGEKKGRKDNQREKESKYKRRNCLFEVIDKVEVRWRMDRIWVWVDTVPMCCTVKLPGSAQQIQSRSQR